MSREVLVFEVDDGTFAVSTANVREVLRAAALFPLPEYPDLIEGGLNLRGEVVPVVSGRAILSRQDNPIHPSDHFIVLFAQTRNIAIHVKRAVALTSIADDGESQPQASGKFISKVVNTEYGPAAILVVEELINACDPMSSPSLSTGQES